MIKFSSIDGDKVVSFLTRVGGLPTEDIMELGPNVFESITENSETVAIGGIELHKPYALLRSVAVFEKARGRGLAKEIVDSLENQARGLGIEEIYLLTTDAGGYFERLGYKERSRETAAEEIKRTTQFSDLCPSSSTLMSKSL